MKDELTAAMHAEFTVSPEIEIKHKAGALWHVEGFNATHESILYATKMFGITYEQAMMWKDFWMNLHEKNEVRKKRAAIITFSCLAYLQCPSLKIYIHNDDNESYCKAYFDNHEDDGVSTLLDDELKALFTKNDIQRIIKTKKKTVSEEERCKYPTDVPKITLTVQYGDECHNVVGDKFEMVPFEKYTAPLEKIAYSHRDILHEHSRRIKIDQWDKIRGDEAFSFKNKLLDFTILDFWKYKHPNIWNETGELAEFIVATALSETTTLNNLFWAVWDLNYKGLRIEVKSTADFHPWNKEKKKTQRVFDIHQVTNRNYVKGLPNVCRVSQVYVFCYNKCKDPYLYKPEDSYPLDLDNWEFYIISTDTINKACGDNSTISLGRVQRLHGRKPYRYDEIKDEIDKYVIQEH